MAEVGVLNSSRLPAGSTLEIEPGVHVPHPHAEVNLPGKPDPRVAGGDAVTETLARFDSAAAKSKPAGLAPFGESKPLAPEVIPNTLTTDLGSNEVKQVKVGEEGTEAEPPQSPGAAEGALQDEEK